MTKQADCVTQGTMRTYITEGASGPKASYIVLAGHDHLNLPSWAGKWVSRQVCPGSAIIT
jgi:hypothetical protein